jgi:hypothetical protein
VNKILQQDLRRQAVMNAPRDKMYLRQMPQQELLALRFIQW